jgi:chromate reductase
LGGKTTLDKIKILAVVGSLRKDSFNRHLALAAKEYIGDRAEFDVLDYQDVPLMNQDIEFPAPEAVKRVRAQVKSADGIWFFTPEYNHFFPGVLKNLIDWLSRPISDSEPQVLWGKPAAISGITPGMSGTASAQDHLVTLISFLNMNVMNAPRLTIPNAMNQLDADGKPVLKASYPYLKRQADAFLDFIAKQIKK